jgi:HEAT repeat protein
MDALVEMFGDRDAGVRLAATQAVASPPWGTDPPKALAKGLRDESAKNRAAAVSGLTFFRQGLDPWVPILLWLAEHDPDPSVRERCFNTLNYAFKPPAVTSASVPDLIASLRSGDAKVRSQAGWILAELRADAHTAVLELLRVMNEPLNPKVDPVWSPSGIFDPASQAALALGRIAPGTPEAKQVIVALIEVARSGPVSRRGWAAYALGEFGPAAEEAVPVLIEVISDVPDDRFERESAAALALGKIAPDTPSADQALAALLPVLKSKNRLSQINAIEALRQFGPRAAAAIPTIRALKEDHDAEIRNAAAKALPVIERASAP